MSSLRIEPHTVLRATRRDVPELEDHGARPLSASPSPRSLALPFFPEMSEGQVARVGEVLRGALEA